MGDTNWINQSKKDQIAFREQIGTGTYSQVYRAFHRNMKAEVAIKKIPKKQVITEAERHFLDNEIKCILEISHPNIVKCYEIFEDSEYFYFVLELVQGQTLLDYINSKSGLGEIEAATIFNEILKAFKYLHHDKHIIHRDIKLENIMFIPPNTVKIIDFGFARKLHDCSEICSTMCGSLMYTSPEMIRDRIYTMSTDVWSLGICLYGMVCGTLPFKDESMINLMDMIVNRQPEFPINLSKIFCDLIGKMLEKDPLQRISLNDVKIHPWMNRKMLAPNRNENINKTSVARSLDRLPPLNRSKTNSFMLRKKRKTCQSHNNCCSPLSNEEESKNSYIYDFDQKNNAHIAIGSTGYETGTNTSQVHYHPESGSYDEEFSVLNNACGFINQCDYNHKIEKENNDYESINQLSFVNVEKEIEQTNNAPIIRRFSLSLFTHPKTRKRVFSDANQFVASQTFSLNE
ncbi:CAMK family protein kinase [Tritrichomonas foetus]|uniref:CAMK family protein kinase n=1 Tax=Tritrichomonas foetus TaxID=1144522 RepID=A0A1J4JAX0_9EUKA|nr:CAMK family protein kinase [Tritrichomonas foetus]|eukprot:OHS96326.1 CAMK family protein kinase [Tritrichomonas foetus]